MILREGPAVPTLLPPGRDLPAWHAALTDEIARHLSPAHAAILARPERTAAGIAWAADGTAMVRYADLPADGRRALDAALGAILSDIRRLAESGVAPAVRDAWPALRDVPDMGHVFAVDGRPVLAAWGHAGVGGRLGRLDDGVAWRAAPRPHWARYGVALGVLAGLALLSGLLLPRAAAWFVEPAPACAIVPGQLDAMRTQLEAESRGSQLQTLLASLTEEIGRRQLLCPIAVLPAPAAPPVVPPATPPPTPPPPRAELPQDRWDRRDLTMLEGCWSLTTGLSVGNQSGGNSRVKSWRLCFQPNGTGEQTESLEDGRRCQGPLRAAFDQGDTLRVTQPSNCEGPNFRVTRSELTCRRLSDTEAHCEGRNVEGPATGSQFSGRFRR